MRAFSSKPVIWLLLITMVLASCGSPLKQMTYMYDAKIGEYYPSVPLPQPYKIRPNDQLTINVVSDDPSKTSFLNIGSDTDLMTYLVDENGNITYPQLGEIQVEGLTLLEIRDKIQGEVDKYVMNTSVLVKLNNRTFTLLGDFNGSGLITMPKNQYTIFEALGVAGGVSDLGNRAKVKLIRETSHGVKIVNIDLTDDALLSSEYYYILPHDVLYVEPGNYRVYSTRTLPWISQASLAFSILSTAFLVLNLFR